MYSLISSLHYRRSDENRQYRSERGGFVLIMLNCFYSIATRILLSLFSSVLPYFPRSIFMPGSRRGVDMMFPWPTLAANCNLLFSLHCPQSASSPLC